MKYHIMRFLTLFITVSNLYCSSLTISQAGQYSIGSNVTYTPGGTDAIVLITSSNVVLDLQNNILAQSGGSGTLNGIEIAAGVSNVTIQNGAIQGTSGAGIYINSGCRDITIQNIQTFTTAQGIVLNGTTANTISNCSMDTITMRYVTNQGILVNNASLLSLSNIVIDTSATTTFAVQLQGGTQSTISMDSVTVSNGGLGIQVASYDDVLLNNCRVYNCSFTGNFKGFFISASNANLNQGFLVQQCSVDSCSGTGSFSGFEITNTYNSTFINCIVNNSSGATSTVRGFLLFQSQNIAIQNCIVDSVSCSAGTPFCSGFEVNNSSKIRCQGCETINTGQGTSYASFYLNSGNQCSLEACTANTPNSGTNGTLAAGYYVNTCSDVIMRNCTSSNFTNNGFTLSSGSSRLIIMQCTAQSCGNGLISAATEITISQFIANGLASGSGISHTGTSGLIKNSIVSNFTTGISVSTTNSNYVDNCFTTNGTNGIVGAASSLTRFYNNGTAIFTTPYTNVSQVVTRGGVPVVGANLNGA